MQCCMMISKKKRHEAFDTEPYILKTSSSQKEISVHKICYHWIPKLKDPWKYHENSRDLVDHFEWRHDTVAHMQPLLSDR